MSNTDNNRRRRTNVPTSLQPSVVNIDKEIINDVSTEVKAKSNVSVVLSPKVQKRKLTVNSSDITLSTPDEIVIPKMNIENPIQSIDVDEEEEDHNTHLSTRAHALLRPAVIVGAIEPVLRKEFIYNFLTGSMYKKEILVSPAIERMFLEIISNAADNSINSRAAKVATPAIIVTVEGNRVTVKSGGLPLPVKINKEHQKYEPFMSFGKFRTGTNYKDGRIGSGCNGIGAKATNVMSSEFTIVVQDAIRHLQYTQTWLNNMESYSDPEIVPFDGVQSTVEVSYVADFVRLNYPEMCHTEDLIALYARYSLDVSFTSRTTVIFNGITFSFLDIKDYASLYFGESAVGEGSIVHYEWPTNSDKEQSADDETKKPTKARRTVKSTLPHTSQVLPCLEFIAIYTADSSNVISFCNCVPTAEGGEHVTVTLKTLTDVVIKKANAEMQKHTKKSNPEEKIPKVSLKDVRGHVSMIISYNCIEPQFSDVCKTKLTVPSPSVKFTPDEIKKVEQWRLYDRLLATLQAKQYNITQKGTGKKGGRNYDLPKGRDANYAGKKQSMQCTLVLTEGKSASGYENTRVGLLGDGGKNFFGLLPLRGKGLNVMNVNAIRIGKNKEILLLNKMLNLRPDADYSKDEDFKTLNYGCVMIMADSDVDGKHITGLILNMFYCLYPSLLQRGFVKMYRTPIIRATKGKNKLVFYTEPTFNKWKEANEDDVKAWNFEYYKGLASSSKQEVKEDMKVARVIFMIYDDTVPNNMKRAFDKLLANERKKWIEQYSEKIGIEDIQNLPISEFLDKELVQYFIANIKRSIPCYVDGLKESQRKIIHGAYKHWGINLTGKKFLVAEFQGYVSMKTKYHHAQDALGDTIVKMTQGYIGSNNIPLLFGTGQMGTREEGGEDAGSGRYVSAQPHPLLNTIFRKEDLPILRHVYDDGKEIEPETYYPIIPISVINGTSGIGTGYSTRIPPHNTLEVVDWLFNRLKNGARVNTNIVKDEVDGDGNVVVTLDDDKENKNIIINDEVGVLRPWFRHFTGTSIISEKKGKRSITTVGRFNYNPNNRIITILELPVESWTHKYRKFLNGLVVNKQIKEYKDNSNDEVIKIEIKGFVKVDNLMKEENLCSETSAKIATELKLATKIGISNIVLVNEKSVPKKYANINDVLEAFVEVRLDAYNRRKTLRIDAIIADIINLEGKLKFVDSVIEGKLDIVGLGHDVAVTKMKELDIDEKHLSVAFTNCTIEGKEKILDDIKTSKDELRHYKQLDVRDIWRDELNEFVSAYKKFYKE